MGFNSLQSVALTLISSALMAAPPANAQMYKWVDERGVVSYSNSPPPSAGKTSKVSVVEDRVSVYTPDELISRAMADESMGNKRRARLEAQAEAAQRAKARQASAQPGTPSSKEAERKTAYDRCVSERRVECDSILSGNPTAASHGYNGLPQYVVGARVAAVPAAPFYVDPTPPPRVGVSTAPPVGISTAPPVGAPQNQRPVGSSR